MDGFTFLSLFCFEFYFTRYTRDHLFFEFACFFHRTRPGMNIQSKFLAIAGFSTEYGTLSIVLSCFLWITTYLYDRSNTTMLLCLFLLISSTIFFYYSLFFSLFRTGTENSNKVCTFWGGKEARVGTVSFCTNTVH